MELILCQGIPASGKSTYAKVWVSAAPDRVRVNRDDIRHMVFGVDYGCDEVVITKVQDAAIHAALKAGKSVIVDNTNIEPRFVKSLVKIGHQYGAKVSIKRFDVSIQECLLRNASRDRKVPESVIRNMHDRLVNFPDIDLAAPVIEKYRPEQHHPAAIIVDIDGTLAHMNGKRGPFDWKNVGLDDIDDKVARLVDREWALGIKILVMSGRDSVCRKETEAWLDENSIHYDGVFMRPEGDMRPDNIVKKELFDTYVKNRYCIEYVLDDRDQVVRMWRAMGLKVFQVEDGDF